MLKRMFSTLAAWSLAAALTIAPALAAQDAARLDAPQAETAEPFSAVSGLRELSDGSLLIADGLEGRLYRATSDLSSVTPIGREGAGPREYRTPDGLFPLGADSTLMVDLGNGRMATLGPDGRIVRTRPIAAGGGPRLQIMMPMATDEGGHVYYENRGGRGPGGPPDSATVMRLDPRSDESQAVARVKLPEMDVRESGAANSREVRMLPVPLSGEDAWTVTPDGRVAAARFSGEAYWLEFPGDGETRRGPDIPYDPVDVGSAEQEAWIAAQTGALGVSVEIENGRVQTSFSRGGGPRLDPDDLRWPDFKPPFPPDALRVDPTGRFWLERHVPAGEARRYDLLDETGRRVGAVRLPEGRRLAGFGDGVVYLTRTDQLDFTWLERFALPVS